VRPFLWVSVYLVVLVWSAIDPKDRFTWFLEVTPALIALLILAFTRRRFPLTSLAYALILAHCIVLMVGGHYTYAEVPLFDWLRESFGPHATTMTSSGISRRVSSRPSSRAKF
jgi:putative membrane protein